MHWVLMPAISSEFLSLLLLAEIGWPFFVLGTSLPYALVSAPPTLVTLAFLSCLSFLLSFTDRLPLSTDTHESVMEI